MCSVHARLGCGKRLEEVRLDSWEHVMDVHARAGDGHPGGHCTTIQRQLTMESLAFASSAGQVAMSGHSEMQGIWNRLSTFEKRGFN